MNCFLNFHRNTAVANSSPPEVSKAASGPSLPQYVTSRTAQQQTTFARHAQAKDAYISAKRHMSPALVNLTTPQAGHSTILRPRFFYPSAVDVKRVYQQDVQQQKPLVVSASEQHQAPRILRPSQLPQEHQPCRQEPSQKEPDRQGGLDHLTACRAANANDHQYVEQQQCGTCLTVSGVPSQHIQQLLSPATNQKSTHHIQQQEQLKNVLIRSSVPEEASYAHQAKPQVSRWASIFVSPQGATNTAVNPCILSPRNSAPSGSTVPSFLEHPGSPSWCGLQLPHAAEPGTRATPLQPRSFSVIPRGSSAGDGTASRDKPSVLHFSDPEASREERCGAPRFVSAAINGTLKPSLVPTPQAVASGPTKAAVGVEHQILAAGDTTAVAPSLADTAVTSGRIAGAKVPSVGAHSGPDRPGNALFALSPSSAVPQQQVTGTAPSLWAQGFQEFTIGNYRAALLPMHRSGDSERQQSRHVPLCRPPVDAALPKNLAATANTQLPTADTNFLQAPRERRGTEEERMCFIHSCAADLGQVSGGSHGVERQQPPRTKLQSIVCDPAGQPRKADRDGTNTVSHSLAAERGTAAAATGLGAGIALGRPRTPLRAPVPQAYMRWQSSREPQPLQAQEHARRYSGIQEQLLLQQQLLELQDQRPYSWASAAIPVGHGSSVVVSGNAPKVPFGLGHIQLEQRPQTSMLLNTLATCCCQPQSPQATRAGSTSPSTCSNGTSVIRNQISCMISADRVACIQIQGQQPGVQRTSINKFYKRPTSAPPGKAGLPPQQRPVVQPHQQRAVASPGAVLASRRRMPWTYQSYHVPQQMNDHTGIDSGLRMQPSPLNAAAPQITPSLAFSSALRGAVSAASSPAAAASVAAGQVSTFSPSALAVPVSYRLEEGTPVPSLKYPRQMSPARTGEGDVSWHVRTEQRDAFSSAGAAGRKASLRAPAEAASAMTAAVSTARAGTDLERKKSFTRSVDASTSLNTGSAQTDGTGISAPRVSKPRFTQQPLNCGSPPGLYSCEKTKQNHISRLLSTQADVGLADVDGTVHKNATSQQPQQPPGITVSQDNLGERNADGEKMLEHGREGNVYKFKTARGADLVTVSAVCGSCTQQQDQLGDPGTYPVQLQQPSDSPKQHFQKLEQREDQQKAKRPEAEQQHEEEVQRRDGERGPLGSLSVAPVIHGTLPRTRDLQNKVSSNGLEIDEIEIHTLAQAPSVGRREEVQHKERSLSVGVEKLQTSGFTDSCVPFLEPPRVQTLTDGGSLCTRAVSFREGDPAQDCAPHTPVTSAYIAASHSTAQDATVGSLVAALNSADSAGIPDRGSVNDSITSAAPSSRLYPSSYRAPTSLVSTREGGLAAEVPETEPLQEHRDEQAAHVFPKNGAACLNITADPVVRSAEVDARTSRSTMGSEGSGTDDKRRGAPGRCSQEGSTSRRSNCCDTSSSRKSCPLQLDDSPHEPVRMVDGSGETCENKDGTSSYSQTIKGGKRSGSSCDTSQAGSGSIPSIEPSIAATENLERRGSSDGGSTATSIQNLGLSEEGSSDVDNEGQEDVIPLPSFLWRSPLSVLKNAAGNHDLCNESDCTKAEVDSLQRLGCRRSTLQCGGSSEDEGEAHKPATAAKSWGNSHVVQRDLPGNGSSSNPADMQLGDFELADPRFGGEASLLGRGTYGVVRLMRHKPTGRLYAVKSIEKSSVVEAGMVSQVEFELLTQKDVLRHRNVLRCHAFLEDIDRVHMILEYCSGGDLYTRIRTQPLRRISEQEAFLYFAQLVNGLHYMHTRCIMHRDLKLENLLLDKDGVLKIADLGWCTTILGKRRNFNFCGTLDYLAPEMIRGDGHDWRVDLWGAGILLYEMLDGKPPFQSTRHLELVQQILKAKISLPPHIPPDAGNLIEQLLQYDPEDRIPLHAICQHPWVKRMWSQLKRHYYSIYPYAAPAAFDLSTPDSTARKYAEDALPGAPGNRKRLLNLREIHLSDAADIPAPTDDGYAKSRKEAESPSQSTDVERHVPALVSFSSPAASPVTSQGLTVAPSTATGRGDASSISSSLATTPGTTVAATPPCKTAAGEELAEARRGSVIPTAHETVEQVLKGETGLKLDSKRAEMSASSSESASPSTSSLQQQRHPEEDSAQISVSDRKEVDQHRLPKKTQDFDAGAAEVKHEYAVGSNKRTERASGGPPDAVEHPVPQQERLLPRDIIDECATAANTIWDRPKEFRPAESSVAASEKKSRTREATGSHPTTSAEPSAGATTVPPAVVSELEHAGTRSAATLQATSSAARAVTPPVAAAGLPPRIREGRPLATGTTAAPQRRTTATATTIRKLAEASPPAALTSRAAGTSPESISVAVERSLTAANSLPHAQVKAKRSGAARRPMVIHPLSKIDSGLGSQKKVLLSPPTKRSALRAGDQWEGSMSSVGEEEQSEHDVAKSLVALEDERRQQDSSAGTREDLQQPTVQGGLQPPTAVNLTQQHHLQGTAQQQQVQHGNQQLPTGLKLLENHLVEHGDVRQGQKLQQPVPQNGEGLRQPWQLQQQSQLQNQWHVEQQPLLHSVCASEHESASFHEMQPSSALQQQRLSNGADCSLVKLSLLDTATETSHESMQQYQHHIQHLQQQKRTQEILMFPEQRALSPTHNHHLQPGTTGNLLPQNETVSQQVPLPLAAWYLQGQRHHTTEQQGFSPTHNPVESGQQIFPKIPASQAVSPHRHLLPHQQQRILNQQQQTFNRVQYFQQPQPPHRQPCRQYEYQQLYQQQQRRDQDQHTKTSSSKELAMNLACHSVQQQEGAILLHRTGPQQQSYGQQHYPLGYWHQRIRSVTPPAPSVFRQFRNPAQSVQSHRYHLAPNHQNVPWHPQASAYTRAQLARPEGHAVHLYNAMAPQEQPQREELQVCSPACTGDNSGASQAACRKAQSTFASDAAGAVSTDVAAAGTLHPIHAAVAPSNADAQISCANGGSSYEEMCPRDDKRHHRYAPGGFAARAGGRAESTIPLSAATSADTATVTKRQGTCPKRPCVPSNALHAYTPRWGGSQQAVTGRCATVAPPSSLPSVASTARLRSLHAVSAPPRSFGAAEAARKHAHGLPLRGNLEQSRQHRPQAQQMRQQGRPGTPAFSQQQQQRGLQQRTERALVGSPLSHQEMQQGKNNDCLRSGTSKADDVRTERLPCFSFGHRREINRRPHESVNTNSDSVLSSSCLSGGPSDDVRLLSHRFNLPDTDGRDSSPLIPSAKAPLALNKLPENATPPRPPKTSGARLLARTLVPRVRATKPTVAARASPLTSVVGSRASGAPAAVSTVGSTAGVPTKSTTSSPKAACSLRQIGSHARFHAQSPPPCGTAAAAVAVAAASWRARAAERESRERRAPAETSSRLGKMVGSNTRQPGCSTEDAREGGQDSSSRKTGTTQIQGHFDLVGKSRVGAQASDASRKTQRLTDLSVRKATRTFPPKSPQTHAAAGRQRQGAGERVRTYREGEAIAPPRAPATSVLTKTREEDFAETNAEVHTSRSSDYTNSNNNAGDSSSSINSCAVHRVPVRQEIVAADNRSNERTASPVSSNPSMPPRRETHLQQQSGPSFVTLPGASCSQGAQSCLDPATCGVTLNMGHPPVNPSVEEPHPVTGETGSNAVLPHGKQSMAAVHGHQEYAQGGPPFNASMRTGKILMSNSSSSPPTSTSPSKSIGPSPIFSSGQTLNTSSYLPGYPFAASAAVAAVTAAQQGHGTLHRKSACQRYWSPPSREAGMTQWRSCSSRNSERMFLSRPGAPQLMNNFAVTSHALKVASGRTDNYGPTANQQAENTTVTGGAGGSSLTFSWTTTERQMYNKRQQTPPPAAASVAAREMRQDTPLSLGMSVGQYHPYHMLKPQAAHSVASMGGHMWSLAAAARGQPAHPNSLSGFWGSAAIAGVSAAASNAACHARLGPAHAHPGKGFGILS